MINEIKQAIAQKILEQYPSSTIYDEDVPQNFKTPSFLITVIEQNYGKRLANKYNSTVSFDVAYFSDKEKNEAKSDCQAVQVNLLRDFDIISSYKTVVDEEPEEPEETPGEPEEPEEPEETLVLDKNFGVLNKNAQIVDNVLHITFDVRYSELKIEEFAKMQTQTTNEYVKE